MKIDRLPFRDIDKDRWDFCFSKELVETNSGFSRVTQKGIKDYGYSVIVDYISGKIEKLLENNKPSTFDEDLKIGEKAEKYILDLLSKEYPTIGKVEGYNPYYDLLDRDGYSAEIKFDRESKKTKNIAIEYRYKGNPSGISTSKAHEWIIIYFSDKWVYSRIERTKLMAFIKTNFKHLTKIKGGDDNRSSLVLIDTSLMEETFGRKELL